MNPVGFSQESEILARIVDPSNPSFTPDVARSILELQFTEADRHEMNDLAEKARSGTLSDEESTKLHAYLFVGGMVDLMHSKARLSLRQSAHKSGGG
ncbi:MAG: hypothetical protein GXX96_19840 [Planctomycetaceae bacterium]|nr:hypothetical protein [Planctomycetaceae bacterium]